MGSEIIEPINKIVIVGGGSAGWITAGILASEHIGMKGSDVSITLIESPDVKTIGVGEGTWPTMRATLQKIGISETRFLLECSASYKQGTKFVGWVNDAPEDYYYHPFTAPSGYPGFNLVPHWQEHREKVSFVNSVGVQGYLCDKGLAPKQHDTPEYAGMANYAYHLDAGKLATLLQKHCTEKLGVRHIADHVTQINGEPDADIRSVTTKKNGEIEGDLFIDCTGMAALLLGQHYQVPFLDKKHILFNDTALAAQLPYADEQSVIASQTISTAQKAGWVWDIGLTTRRGIGYTYSSAHTTDEEAHKTLKQYVDHQTGVDKSLLEPRKISFKPGHRQEFWHKNCVAIGLSAGFLEPLEASALVLIELSANMISENLPVNRKSMEITAKRFNEKFRYRWDRIIDFLKLHYVLSQRTDSDFWVDNRNADSIPDSLQELLALWQHHYPEHRDFSQIDEVFSTASHQYILYGMGFSTEGRVTSRLHANVEKARELFQKNSKLASQSIRQLPTNRELLSQIYKDELAGTG